jgi:hypothetical protein
MQRVYDHLEAAKQAIDACVEENREPLVPDSSWYEEVCRLEGRVEELEDALQHIRIGCLFWLPGEVRQAALDLIDGVLSPSMQGKGEE